MHPDTRLTLERGDCNGPDERRLVFVYVPERRDKDGENKLVDEGYLLFDLDLTPRPSHRTSYVECLSAAFRDLEAEGFRDSLTTPDEFGGYVKRAVGKDRAWVQGIVGKCLRDGLPDLTLQLYTMALMRTHEEEK